MQRRQKLGQEIKARRMGLGMSQRELADAIGHRPAGIESD